MIQIAHSQAPDARAAAAELRARITLTPRIVVYFAGSRFDGETLAAAVHDAFGGVPSMGCTTAGELVSGAMAKGSVVLMAMDDATVARAAVAVVDDAHDPSAVDRALASLASSFGAPVGSLDVSTHLGLVLHDGLSVAEEAVMDRLGDRTNLPFIGGSAGDDARFERTLVFADGRARTTASVLAVLELRRPFRILKTQSFEVLPTVLRVTDVDERTRTVRAFDGRPAAEAYAEAVGVSVGELPSRFRENPLGLVMSDGEPFVRSPQQVKGTDVVFYCKMSEGMELHVLRARDIVEDTRRDLAAATGELGGVSAVINFHCILRTLELEEKGMCAAYGALFRDVPTIGLSTYGESYVGHINQTSTMVLFR